MEILFIALYLLFIVFVGYVFILEIDSKKSLWTYEVILLSPSIGAGIVGFLLFYLSIFGISTIYTLSTTTGICIFLMFLHRKRYLFQFKAILSLFRRFFFNPSLYKIDFLLFLVIFIIFSSVITYSLVFPVYEWDAFAIWMLKAKIIFFENQHIASSQYFFSPSLGYTHPEYPLLFPSLISGIFTCIARIDNVLGKVMYPFILLGFICLLYSSARWKLNRTNSLLITCIGISVPAVWQISSVGLADMPLALFYGGSLLYIIKSLQNHNNRIYLILAFTFSVFCALTKNEGFALAIINIFVFSVFRLLAKKDKKSIKEIIVFVLLFAVIILPWHLFSADIPRFQEAYFSRIKYSIIAENIGRLKVIIPEFCKQGWNFYRWGALLLLLICSSLWKPQIIKEKTLYITWILFFLHLFLYIFVYIITPWDLKRLMIMSLHRILIHTVPSIILIISLNLYFIPNYAVK
ncbi:MAG: hypothetical protein U9O87_00775 [Verrucomicrobiota bacterium]|nr:hypothetical protein [Verrucomicrobiota bacterium]